MKTLERTQERVRNFVNQHSRAIFTLLVFFMLLGISSLSEVTDKAKEGADTILDVAKYILAAVLGIALVFVIYSLATNNPHAKEYLLGWIIAVVVIMVAFLII